VSAPTMRDLLVALSLASGLESLDLRERHLARARALANQLREELDRVESDLCAREKELERRIALEKDRVSR